MSIVQSDAGVVQILNKYFKNISPAGGDNYHMKLFTNDITPTDTSVTASFTEASGGGYNEKIIVPADFVVSTQSGIVQVAIPQQSFVFTGPLTANLPVYGYYIVDDDEVYIFGDRALAPYTPLNAGDLFAVSAVYQMSKGTPA